MMEIQPEVGSVVGQTDEAHWGQVLQTPSAYAVVEVEEEAGGAMKLGVSVLTKLTEELSSLPVSLHGFEQIVQSIEGRWIQSIILLVPVGRIIYLVLRGRGRVYLKRADRLSRLMDEPGALSGEVKDGDTLILATPGFTSTLPEEKLVGVFNHSRAKEVAEKLTLLTHEEHAGFGGAALVFQVSIIVPSEEAIVSTIAQVDSSTISVKQTRLTQRFILFGMVRSRLMQLISGLFRLVLQVRLLKDSNRRRSAMLVAICFVVFFVSVALGLQKQWGARKNQEAVRVLGDAQHAFDEGSALIDLNPVKGRQRLSQAKDLLETLTKTLSPRSSEGRSVSDLYKQVNDRLTLALHMVKEEPAFFFDASLLKKDARVSDIALNGSMLALLDTPGATVYTLVVSSKNGQVVGGGELYSRATHVAIHGEKVYTLVSSGVHELRLSDKKTVPNVAKATNEWGKVESLVAFGGNLYLLDTQKSRIWKYIATDRGFSELREYLNPDTLPDLSRATSMAIDGSVWLGTGDGRILRFTAGKENTFLAQGVEPVFGQDLRVYTDDEVKSLYVLDRDNKRVVVLDKDGVYQAQYGWEGSLNPNQIVVSEVLRKILLLTEGKIFSLELK